jgi:hypothetical protein
MNKIVYTVILGKGYSLKEPRYKNNDWEFKCFTDQKFKSKNWKIVPLNGGFDPRKKSREVKITNHRFFDYDLCLYLDARFTVNMNLDDLAKKYLQNDVAVMSRKKRINSYEEELELCMELSLDNEKILRKQLNQYKNDGFPKNSMLYSPGIMFKRNTEKTREFMEYWYKEVETHSYRDIVSFAYTLWKHPIKISVMPHRKTYQSFMNYRRE